MADYLKPFVIPAVLHLIAFAIEISPIQSAWLGGLLWGIAIFWLVFALLANTALARRFPWLVDYLPFLASSGRFTPVDQLEQDWGHSQFRSR